ncbi:RNAse P Rpr2/Rpp21/SNM1 subunit domain-containing protein [Gamsiella multidivaricata]|uniref:RNAse P Rpr2/Rpp21/SNM1 subunit domain-containing protein n=1 Tax=Gamsiella multidivaricata TaxID=101098 RepID=UPI00221F2B5C|nr:RNAse P Rpr2/Rpp21/SNM1 subunit domain-containing protein [Gamsiella multidivaricata]KAI7831579.1 RNAse P Rpr2/Rpp21/SNM1 subunit domain-containing protein [Gamsiella multidivaricata]
MAKKDKKGECAVQNREIFQRMNFLYQAAMFMATITTPSASTQVGANEHDTTDSSTVAKNNTLSNVITVEEHEATVALELAQGTDLDMTDIARRTDIATSTTAANLTPGTPPRKLSRRKRRELLRERKNKIAMEQISKDKAHHGLAFSNRDHDLHPLSGTARFYTSTMREIGRKNVIRVGPAIKRTICLRCEALLIPSVSCEVRIRATPQLHSVVTCTACGAFRRYFCMPGRGIENDRWEPEKPSAANSPLTEELSTEQAKKLVQKNAAMKQDVLVPEGKELQQDMTVS